MKRYIYAIAIAGAGLLAAAGLVAPLPAAATPTVVNCVGDSVGTYDPGVTNVAQTLEVAGHDEASCVSLTHPTLTSFTADYSGEVTKSCATLFGGGSGTQTIYWNGSSTVTSAWSWSSTSTTVNGTYVLTVTGPITSGTLAGSTLTQVVTFVTLDLGACSRPGGLTGYDAPSTWIFSSL